MVWLGITLFVFTGTILLIWRKELTYLQAASFGANMHPGCAVAEAVVLFLLALVFFLFRHVLQ